MNEVVHISGWFLGIAGSVVGLLLAIIAVFLGRLLRQFDNLSAQFSTLNATMLKIDGDLSGEVGILKRDSQILYQKVEDFEPIWDRMRVAENDIATLKAGGCDVLKRCEQ